MPDAMIETVSNNIQRQPRELALRTSGVKSDLQCLIVHSDQKHVKHIYKIVNEVERVLREFGIEPGRLGEEIRSLQDYLKKLEELTSNCVLAIVIFDGFRPNVLFEFGFLKGRNKPIILLQSNDASINVKSLYKQSTNKGIKDSGLKESAFNEELKNPLIDHNFHLSDLAGKHIKIVNWEADESDDMHPAKVLKKELGKHQNEIYKEMKIVIEKQLQLVACDLDKKTVMGLLESVDIIIKMYLEMQELKIKKLERISEKIKDVAQKNKFELPSGIQNMIAGLHERNYKKLVTQGFSK